ncbi:hypothetical protein KSP39_PZI006615 [Platanthera zijinensis]|uniref:Transmembrane protein n=1 Tax=Platanthera zijinensis TaxID=2320716 RepID=A0AAP0G9X8_9ASPA
MSSLQPQLPPAPPSSMVYQPPYASHIGRGSIGPLIAVLAVITVFGILAGVVGRLCSGRRIVGLGPYDVEGWIERKCSSCIEARIELTTPPPLPPPQRSSDDGPGSSSGITPEIKHSPPGLPESTQP